MDLGPEASVGMRGSVSVVKTVIELFWEFPRHPDSVLMTIREKREERKKCEKE